MRTIKKGATSQTIYVSIADSTSTTGGKKTGLAYNTASLTAYYVRSVSTPVAITLATLAAANTAWSSGGFKEVDSANMPGIYRLDVPDAALASGAETVVISLKGATGMVQVDYEITLVDNLASDVYTRIGAPAGASIAADIATLDDFVDTEVGAIKAKTDNLPSDPADASDIAGAFVIVGNAISALSIPTANQNADALLDRAAGVETNRTLRQALRLMLAALAGKASGMGTTTATFRDTNDSVSRIVATVDADGNRSAVTLDAS